MNKIILDFTGCKYLGDIHKVLKKEFGFPEYYGENLSALWDCLDNYCDYILSVYIKGFEALPINFHDYRQKLWDVFCRVSENNPNISFQIID